MHSCKPTSFLPECLIEVVAFNNAHGLQIIHYTLCMGFTRMANGIIIDFA